MTQAEKAQISFLARINRAKRTKNQAQMDQEKLIDLNTKKNHMLKRLLKLQKCSTKVLKNAGFLEMYKIVYYNLLALCNLHTGESSEEVFSPLSKEITRKFSTKDEYLKAIHSIETVMGNVYKQALDQVQRLNLEADSEHTEAQDGSQNFLADADSEL